jgi:glutamate synthase domain-containing protein 3
MEMVDLDPLKDAEEIARLHRLIERHRDLTGSDRADAVLADWARCVKRFVKVFPKDYRRMLAAIAKAEKAGLSGNEALQAAFEENIHDTARVAGN